MAKALPAGRAVRRRPVFGLFDPEGWAWASTKAFFWLIVIIMVLGYIPDRAYYFLVSRTIDLGVIGWSPINLCPPENGSTMPCPVPGGGILPWQLAPRTLPAARANGSAVQLGKNLLYIGGRDASKAPSGTVYVATIDKGVIGEWTEGAALPAAREGAALATLTGTAYLIGGLGPDGKPTDTVWSLGIDPNTSKLTTWRPVCTVAATAEKPCADDKVLKLPEARSGAAAVAVTDGIVVVGGRGPDGKPTTTAWKTTVDSKSGAPGAFVAQPSLLHAVTDAAIAFEGTFVWVYGGSDEAGPVGAVQRADYGAKTAAAASGAPAAASPSASGTPAEGVVKWAINNDANLPGARTGAAGFNANGAIYLIGGTDGTSSKRELYWALPNSAGDLPGGWRHLEPTDLPGGLTDAAPVVSGSTAILIGGSTDSGLLSSVITASLAPQEPFFRVGLVGVTVPGLKIGGEIGQQLGYVAAAGVGTGNFVILIVVGWAFNHRPQIRAWWQRRKLEREAKAPDS
jgi:hypothetical protein